MDAQAQADQPAFLPTGDIVWHVWDRLRAYDPQLVVQLWEDVQGNLAAFSLLYPQYAGFNLEVHPRYHAAGLAVQALGRTRRSIRIVKQGEVGRRLHHT